MDSYSSLLTLPAENSHSSKIRKMAHNPPLSLFFLLLLFLLHCFSHFSFSSTFPDPYYKSIPIDLHPSISEEYFELTKPFPSDSLNPSCHLLLLQKDFGNTIRSAPVSVLYSPTSDCPGPWTLIALEFHATCHGEQYNWISSLWLDGIEILRTSSLETTKSGIAWKVLKDVTRYSSLFSQSNLTLTMNLKNVVNDVYNGLYHVNVTLMYYGDKYETTVSPSEVTDIRLNRKSGVVLTEKTVDQIHDGDVFFIEEFENSERRLGFHYDEAKTEVGLLSQEPGGKTYRGHKSDLFYEKPADLIIPISNDGEEGFWFQIRNELDVHSKRYGQLKEVEQKIKVKTEVRVKSDTGELIHGAIFERKYALSIKTSTRPGSEQDTCLLINKLSQAMNKKITFTSPTEEYSSSLSKSQDSRGWMVVRDHYVLSSKASTQQTLSYKDESSCYSRTVSTTDRNLLEDISLLACASSS